MCVYFIKNTGLLPAPVPGKPQEIVIVHLAVQFVRIHRINTLPEIVVFGLKPLYRFIPLPLHIGMARPHCLAYLLKNLAVDSQLTKYLGELPLYGLLSHILARTRRWLAAAGIAGAVVVGVFSILALAHDQATALGAFDELREGENMLYILAPGSATVCENRLNPLPNLRADDGSMRAPVNIPVPFKPPRIKPIMQNVPDGAFCNRRPALSICQTEFSGFLGDLGDGIIPGGV